jgi:oligopeptide transport system ATP-binding protein
LFRQPKHPYTKALMSAMPSVHAKGETLYTIPGMPPDLSRPIVGCPFAPRCEHAVAECRGAACALREVASNHCSACVRVQAGEL